MAIVRENLISFVFSLFRSIASAILILWVAFSHVAQAATFVPDDCEFIRLALLDPHKTEIVIPTGIYTANRPIVMNRSGVSLVGQGKVTIRLADHSDSPLLILGNLETPAEPVFDLAVRNIKLNGNRTKQSRECWGGPCDSGGKTNIRNNGITIRGVHRAHISKVETVSMRSGGIVTEKVCTQLHIDGLISKDNYFDGFAGYETTNSLFENLDLSENLGAAISLDIGFHNNKFTKLKMRKNTDVSIFMRDANNNHFFDFQSIDSGNHAIFVSQVDDQGHTTPLNNIFENFVVDGARGNGFYLNGPGYGNKIIRAKFKNIRGRNVFESIPEVLAIFPPNIRCEMLF